jgi:hypothetical protein
MITHICERCSIDFERRSPMKGPKVYCNECRAEVRKADKAKANKRWLDKQIVNGS